MPIILPKSPRAPTHKNPVMLVLYGMQKVGKTSILTGLENTFIADLEEGTKYLSSLSLCINNLNELQQVLDQIIAEKRPYQRIAIDTITKLEEWCEISATRRYKNSAVGKNFTGNNVLELPNGGGYMYLREEFQNWITKIKQCAPEIILVCHIKDKYIAGTASIVNGVELAGAKTDVKVVSKQLDLCGKLSGIVCAEADTIGYLYRNKEQKLCVSFQSDEEITCMNRIPRLVNQKFEFDWKKIYID